MRPHSRKALQLLLPLILLISSPAAAAPEAESLVETARTFRELLANERWDEARQLMSADPRRWFEERDGEGRPWMVGPSSGPWSSWDDEFNSTSTVVEWRGDRTSATARVLEINDYFRLLERGAVTNEITYFFDEQSRIDGLLIRAVGERPAGRTREFLRWALENEPRELRELMPKGDIDPTGDHPQRFRALLERWREETGLPDLTPEEPAESPILDGATTPEAKLRDLAERFVRGWLAGDESMVMATLASDAVLMPHHGVEPVEGEAAIRAFWFPSGPAARVTRFEQTYDEIDQTGDLGWIRGRFVLAFEWEGRLQRNEGNFLMLCRRDANGEWKITHRIWNDPVPQD